MRGKFTQTHKQSAVCYESILSGECLLEAKFSYVCLLASPPQVYANLPKQ